jgi:hypothetical protein
MGRNHRMIKGAGMQPPFCSTSLFHWFARRGPEGGVLMIGSQSFFTDAACIFLGKFVHGLLFFSGSTIDYGMKNETVLVEKFY